MSPNISRRKGNQTIIKFGHLIETYCVSTVETASRVFLLSNCVAWRLPITLNMVDAFNIQSYIRYRQKHQSNKSVGKGEDCNFWSNATMLMKRIFINILEILLFCLNVKILYVYKQSLRHNNRNGIKSDYSLKQKACSWIFANVILLQFSEMANSK